MVGLARFERTGSIGYRSSTMNKLEVAVGLEPTKIGFADRRLDRFGIVEMPQPSNLPLKNYFCVPPFVQVRLSLRTTNSPYRTESRLLHHGCQTGSGTERLLPCRSQPNVELISPNLSVHQRRGKLILRRRKCACRAVRNRCLGPSCG